MRYLITVLFVIGFLLILNLKAANYMTKEDIIKAKEGKAGTTTWVSQGPCEVKNKKPCYLIGKDFTKYYFKKVWVDNLKKPKWGQKRKTIKCEGFKQCYELLKTLDCSKLPGGGYSKFINFNYSSIYCIKLIGYKKLLVERFVE